MRIHFLILLLLLSFVSAQQNSESDPFDNPFFNSDTEADSWANETQNIETTTIETGEVQFPQLELTRKSKDGSSKKIKVVRQGFDDQTGIFVFCQPPENLPPDSPTIAVFSESGEKGVQITINNNTITVPLAVVTQKQDGDGAIEAGGGIAKFLDAVPEGKDDRLSLCAVDVQKQEQQKSVKVQQGQTNLTGTKLRYDDLGIAFIDGPIEFFRGGESPLSGTSKSIEVDVDTEKTILLGNVRITSKGGRVSTARKVIYDDQNSIAHLIGTSDEPATSTAGNQSIEALEIFYNLNTDEAIAISSENRRIKGSFEE